MKAAILIVVSLVAVIRIWQTAYQKYNKIKNDKQRLRSLETQAVKMTTNPGSWGKNRINELKDEIQMSKAKIIAERFYIVLRICEFGIYLSPLFYLYLSGN